MTALHAVAMGAMPGPVTLLLEFGADPNTTDAEGMTLLDYVRRTQEHCSDPNQEATIQLLKARQTR